MSGNPSDFSTGLMLELPDREALQAIGEVWVRLSQMEAWLDVGLGHLLGLGWSATHSVVANLNMRQKIAMAHSLVALRVQRLGDSEARQVMIKRLNEIANINDERTTFAHGRHLLEIPGDVGTLVKTRADHRYIHPKIMQADPTTIRSTAENIKKVTRGFMHALGYEFPDMDVHQFYAR